MEPALAPVPYATLLLRPRRRLPSARLAHAGLFGKIVEDRRCCVESHPGVAVVCGAAPLPDGALLLDEVPCASPVSIPARLPQPPSAAVTATPADALMPKGNAQPVRFAWEA